MSQPKGSNLAQLVSEKKILEELLSVREQTVQEQSQKLSQILGELHARASELESSQEELSRQTQILQSILNSLTVGVVVANSKGQFILFNPTAEEMLGVGTTETLPDEWTLRYGLYLPDKVTPFAKEELPLFRSLNGGEIVHDVQMFIRNPKKPNGLLISVSSSPLMDRDGNIQGGVAVFYDITENKRMEELLRRSARGYAELFLGAADPIVVLDKFGCIQASNPAVEKIAGYAQSDLIGRHFIQTKIITPAFLPKAIQEFAKIILGHESFPFELEVISKTGTALFLEAHARRVHKGDEFDNIQVIFRDMTERKKSECKLKIQHAVTRVLSETLDMDEAIYRVMETVGKTLRWDTGAIWKIDAQTKEMKCFQVWRQDMLLSKFDETSRKSIFELGEGLPGMIWQRGESVCISDLSKEKDTLRLRESFPPSARSGFGFPIRVNGQIIGVMEFFSENMEKSDQNLLQMLDTIGGQIGQFMETKKTEQALMLKQVELAKAQAEREQLEIFAYVASHDLQEPLQKILAYTEFMKAEMPEDISPKIREYLEKLQKNSLRMSTLTSDLLKYMKASSKSGMTDWVALTAILSQVLNEMDDEIRTVGAKIECGPLPILKADARQMHQLFQNLISNAIKFRKIDRPLHVIISSRDSDQGYVEVVVQDNGIGFDEKYSEQIFKAFEKLHGADEYAGSGIGLAICRKIAERHRGSIQVQSREGYGSIFVLKVPVA